MEAHKTVLPLHKGLPQGRLMDYIFTANETGCFDQCALTVSKEFKHLH